MSEKNGPYRIRSPLGDADRRILSSVTQTAIRDEVLDIVVERLARDLEIAATRTPLTLRDQNAGRLVEPRVPTGPPSVQILPRESDVLARIG